MCDFCIEEFIDRNNLRDFVDNHQFEGPIIVGKIGGYAYAYVKGTLGKKVICNKCGDKTRTTICKAGEYCIMRGCNGKYELV